MNFLKSIFLLVFSLAGTLKAERAADFEYGPRPTLPVFDPGEVLDPAWAKKIAEPLAENLTKDGVDVFVVVLKELGNAPPEHVAKQFSSAWCKSPLHCIVLHVPGDANSPWIFPAGRLADALDSSTVEKEVSAAQRRASSEPDDAHRVKAAALEASDLIRYWLGGAILRSETILTESSRIRLEQEEKSRKNQIILFAALAAIIPLAVGVALIVNMFKKRGPVHFSNYPRQARLGAPHAGGNQAVTNLGAPPKS